MVLAFEGENDDLRAEIATLKSLIFGARSERLAIVCAEQIALDLERTAGAQPPANDDKPDAPRPKRRKARRNIGALPAHLPRVERVIEPASTLCPCCTGQMHRIGEESSEALDRFPRGCVCSARSVQNTPAAPVRARLSRPRHRRGSSRAAWRRRR